MILTSENKRALRRVKADRMLNNVQLAQELGVARETLQRIINNPGAENVRPTTYQKIMQFITENY